MSVTSRSSSAPRQPKAVSPSALRPWTWFATLHFPRALPWRQPGWLVSRRQNRPARLIPLCHDLNLDHIDVDIRLEKTAFAIRSEVTCRRATGVEMEALTAVAVAALTLYDMCKAVDSGMSIEAIRLVSKKKEDLP